MSLPVIPFGSEVPVTVLANAPNDNQITLPGGKVVVQINASSPVTVGFWGPYPSGAVVDPTVRPKPGLLAVCGTNVIVGNDALAKAGNYLLEVTSPTTATVEILVRSWTIGDNFRQYWWKLTSANKC